jgi:hypothetical protein
LSDRAFKGSCLNVDDAAPLPIRRTLQPRNEISDEKTLWLFGGSTQFGVDVPDQQTIASHLAAILSMGNLHYTVVNHGHTSFYSSQELALFIDLLRRGQKADVAVFLDGLNDSAPFAMNDETMDADSIAGAVAAQSSRQIIVTPEFPPVKTLNLLHRLTSRSHPESAQTPMSGDPVDTCRFNRSVIRSVAREAGVKVAFFWQPTPFDYIKDPQDPARASPTFVNIPRWNARVRDGVNEAGFHFIADLFRGHEYEDVYVDHVHYGDKGCLLVAQAIAAGLKQDAIAP